MLATEPLHAALTPRKAPAPPQHVTAYGSGNQMAASGVYNHQGWPVVSPPQSGTVPLNPFMLPMPGIPVFVPHSQPEEQQRAAQAKAAEEARKLAEEQQRRNAEQQRQLAAQEAQARAQLQFAQQKLVQEHMALAAQLSQQDVALQQRRAAEQAKLEEDKARYMAWMKEEQERQHQALLEEKARLDQQVQLEKQQIAMRQLQMENANLQKAQQLMQMEQAKANQEMAQQEFLRQTALKLEQERLLYTQHRQQLEHVERIRQEELRQQREAAEREINAQKQYLQMVEQEMMKERQKVLGDMKMAELLVKQQQELRAYEEVRRHQEMNTYAAAPIADWHDQQQQQSTSQFGEHEQQIAEPSYYTQDVPDVASDMESEEEEEEVFLQEEVTEEPYAEEKSLDSFAKPGRKGKEKVSQASPRRNWIQDESLQEQHSDVMELPLDPAAAADAKFLRSTFEEFSQRPDAIEYKVELVHSKETKKNKMAVDKVEHALLHIYSNGIVIMDKKKKRVIERYLVTQIRRFAAKKNLVYVDCGAFRNSVLLLGSKKAADICKVLENNIATLSRKVAEAEKQKILERQALGLSPRSESVHQLSQSVSPIQPKSTEQYTVQPSNSPAVEKTYPAAVPVSAPAPVPVQPAESQFDGTASRAPVPVTAERDEKPKKKKTKAKKKTKSAGKKAQRMGTLSRSRKNKSQDTDLVLERVATESSGVVGTATGGLRLKDKPYLRLWLPDASALAPDNIVKLRKRKTFTVGSGSDVDVQLPPSDARITPLHALIKEINGALVLYNLNAENPVHIDGQPARAPTPLQPGNVLTIGEARLVVCNKSIDKPIKRSNSEGASMILRSSSVATTSRSMGNLPSLAVERQPSSLSPPSTWRGAPTLTESQAVAPAPSSAAPPLPPRDPAPEPISSSSVPPVDIPLIAPPELPEAPPLTSPRAHKPLVSDERVATPEINALAQTLRHLAVSSMTAPPASQGASAPVFVPAPRRKTTDPLSQSMDPRLSRHDHDDDLAVTVQQGV